MWLPGWDHDSTGYCKTELLAKDIRLLDFYLPTGSQNLLKLALVSSLVGFLWTGLDLPGFSVPLWLLGFDSSTASIELHELLCSCGARGLEELCGDPRVTL